MEASAYLGSSVIVMLGIFIGAILGHSAKEELRKGRKYFAIMQAAIILALIIASVYYEIMKFVPVFLLFLLLVWIESGRLTKEQDPRFYYVLYAVFAFAFFSASLSGSFIIFDSLIFLFGLPTGSLLYMKKNYLKDGISLSALFLAITTLLFILLGTLMLP